MAEAAAYAEEAEWLLRHGLKTEAAQAAETAIALGDTRQSTEVLRLRAYAEEAYPENLDPNLVQEADSSFETSDVPAEKLPRSIAMATIAANLSADYAKKYAAMPRGKNRDYEHPTVICVRTMPIPLSVLRSALMAGYWKDNRGAVDDLRDAIKRQIEAVGALPLRNEKPWLDALGTFYRHLIVFAPLWNDSPEETLRFMDRVLSPAFEEDCRDGMILARRSLHFNGFVPPAIPTSATTKNKWSGAPKRLCPRLIDWTDPGNPRVDKMWKDYVESKLRSPDTLEQADGLSFLWSSQSSYQECDSLAPRFVEFFDEHCKELVGRRGEAIWLQIYRPIKRENQWIGSNENRIKTLAAFERLLTGQTRLAPGVAGAAAMSVPYEKPGRVKLGDGERLLAALASYDRMLGDSAYKSDTEEIRSAKNMVIRRFPQLAPTPPPDALAVTRAWIDCRESQPGSILKCHFDPESGIWHEGKLWFIDESDRKIWRINPVSFETEVLAPEDRPCTSGDEKGTTGGPNIGDRNKRALFVAGKIFLPGGGGVWVYHRAENSWKPMALPDGHYSLWKVGNKIFASFGERSDNWEFKRGEGAGLYEIIPGNDTAQLIFSTRRRPGKHPLDTIEAERPFCVLPSDTGEPLIGFLSPASFRYLSGKPADVLSGPRQINNIVSREGDTLFSSTEYGHGTILRGVQRVTPAGKRETLLWNPSSNFPLPEEPVWKYPSSIPDPSKIAGQIDYRAAMRGEDLILLTYQSGTTPWGAGTTDLYLFRRGEAEAKHVPISFRLSREDVNLLKRVYYDSDSFAYPHIAHYGLVPTDVGLAITGRAMPGFWFIPWAELEAYGKSGS